MYVVKREKKIKGVEKVELGPKSVESTVPDVS